MDNGLTKRGRIGLTKRRWSRATQEMYNSVDIGIRNESKISVFKKRIKVWIKCHIYIFKGDE